MEVRAALTNTLECAMMISTRNRDEKSGPPFVNSLGTFRRPYLHERHDAENKKNHFTIGSEPLGNRTQYDLNTTSMDAR